ncbi:hypothetical protein [Kutzneria sp. 744]|uniref:hypothetical protein n=1 Tax=Kutzneria sp. (strain 744) TaxID=345341 RepID=UPI0012FCED47|nr:hypothetical protein [Kutzneria sp. 744]
MSEAGTPTVRVELALVPNAVPIQGWARNAVGAEHAFTGWLELLQILDAARMTEPAADGETP